MVLICIFMYSCFAGVTGQFLGGTISFRSIPIRKQIQLTIKTTWENGKGPCGNPCRTPNVGSMNPSSQFKNQFLKFGNGSNSNFDMNYVLTTLSLNPSFEQGERRFTIGIPNTPSLELSFNSVLWSTTANESLGNNVHLITTIFSHTRNDTALPNSSPVVPLPPYVGVLFGCKAEIKIPIIDPEDDEVTCRWAEPHECGQACSNIPRSTLDQESCTIEVDVTSANGYHPGQKYRVTLVTEDSPRHDVFINGNKLSPGAKLSAIPLQFIIHVVSGTGTCTNEMDFVPLTLPKNQRVPYPFNLPKLENVVYIESANVRNTTFLVSGPNGCTYHQLSDDRGRHNVTRLYEQCHFTPRDQILGDTLICVWGVDPLGVTSQGRCVNIIVAGRNECASSPCHGNETCYNLFMQHSCRCSNGNKGPSCLPDPEILQKSAFPLDFIIGGAGGGLLFLLLICLVVLCLYKAHKKSSRTNIAKQEKGITAVRS